MLAVNAGSKVRLMDLSLTLFVLLNVPVSLKIDRSLTVRLIIQCALYCIKFIHICLFQLKYFLTFFHTNFLSAALSLIVQLESRAATREAIIYSYIHKFLF